MLVATVHVATHSLSVFRLASQRVGLRVRETARSDSKGLVVRPEILLDVLLEPYAPVCVAGLVGNFFCCKAPGRFLEGVLEHEPSAE